MTFKPTVVPSHPLKASEDEVRRAEQEAQALEGQIAAELQRVEEASRGLDRRLQQVKANAAQLQLGGLRSPDFAAFQQRLQGVALPSADVDGPRAQALDARIEAVNARIGASQQIRAQMSELASRLNALQQQLGQDEAALGTFEALLREETARRQQQGPPTQRQPVPAAATQVERASRPPAVPPAIPKVPPVAQSPELSTAEPRQQRRVKMQASIDIESDSNFFQGFSTNISEGGLFIATVQLVPQGTPVDLHFSLPNGSRIDAKGVVRWVREVNDRTPDIFPGVGIQFTELDAEGQHAIRQFLVDREPMFFPTEA